MKTKAILLASSAVAALSLAAPAQAAGNWYVSVFGGANWSEDHSFSVATSTTTSADTLTWSTDSDTGWIVGGAVGLSLAQLAPGLRVELEASYRENSVDGLWASNITTPTVVSSGALDIDHSTFAVMANAWYDFTIVGVNPYIGGGIGWAETELEGTYLGAFPAAVPFSFEDSGFAWQAGAGIKFDISPNMKLGVGYRYFDGPEVTVIAPGTNTATAEVDNENHTVLVDLTFNM